MEKGVDGNVRFDIGDLYKGCVKRVKQKCDELARKRLLCRVSET